uniref:Putative ovule protein n=1 Tax=Solanum chacoense TaxID=4108 RepID=A0A0V0GNL6_SOLCH
MRSQCKERLLEMTGYVEGEFPIRYLGLQLSPKKWSKIECNQLCQKIIERSYQYQIGTYRMRGSCRLLHLSYFPFIILGGCIYFASECSY